MTYHRLYTLPLKLPQFWHLHVICSYPWSKELNVWVPHVKKNAIIIVVDDYRRVSRIEWQSGQPEDDERQATRRCY